MTGIADRQHPCCHHPPCSSEVKKMYTICSRFARCSFGRGHSGCLLGASDPFWIARGPAPGGWVLADLASTGAQVLVRWRDLSGEPGEHVSLAYAWRHHD